MARPNKKYEDKKPHRITVRFGDQEYAKICSDAEAIGVTVSKFMREKIMRGFIRVPKYAKIDARNIALLSKLSGLFKKSYTDTGGVYADKTAAILDEIISLMLKMNREFDNDRKTYNEEPQDAQLVQGP
jgi:hypothetical protein